MESVCITARGVIFDLRNGSNIGSKLINIVQELYETSLLSHTYCSSNFTHLSLVIVGPKGHEELLVVHSLAELDQAFKKAFVKLRQLVKLSQQMAIYPSQGSFDTILAETVSRFREALGVGGPRWLEITLVTDGEEQKLLAEVESFLLQTNYTQTKMAVLHVSPSGTYAAHEEIQESLKNKLTWHYVMDAEKDSRTFFKGWLVKKKKNWKVTTAGKDGWTLLVGIDIEDASLENPYSYCRMTMDFMELAVEEDENTLELTEWVRRNGVPAELIYGPSRRLVLPADHGALQLTRFRSLTKWLIKEDLVAIAQLRVRSGACGRFVLFPGPDGSLLLRNIASRELILPARDHQQSTTRHDLEREDLMRLEEKSRMEIHNACLKVPVQLGATDGPSTFSGGSVFKAIEKKMMEDILLKAASKRAQPHSRPSHR